MSTRLVRSLYGSPNGDWMITTTPENTITPPTIHIGHPRQRRLVELSYIGSPGDAFAKLNYTMDQAELAVVSGVTQQAVSRYVTGSSEPRLESEAWVAIVGLLFQRTTP